MISSAIYLCLETTDKLIRQVISVLHCLLSLFSTPPPPPPKRDVWSMQFVSNYTTQTIKFLTSQLTILNTQYLRPPALIALCLVLNGLDVYRFSRALPFVRKFYNYKQGYFIVNSFVTSLGTLPLQLYVCYKAPQMWLTIVITTINFLATLAKLIVVVYCRKFKNIDLKYTQSVSFPLYSQKQHFCGVIYLTIWVLLFHIYQARSYDFLERIPSKYAVLNWASYGTLINVCFVARLLVEPPVFSTLQMYLQHSYSLTSKASLEPALLFACSLYNKNPNSQFSAQFTWFVIELVGINLIAFRSILSSRITELHS